MSDTNRVAIRVAREASYGVVPTAPDLQEMFFTGLPGLAFAPETAVSDRIRSDRQITDLPLVGGEAGGDINDELSFDVHALLLEGAFFSTFQTRFSRISTEAVTEITDAVASTDHFVVTDESDLPLDDAIIRVEGFVTAANNGFHIVTASTTTTVVCAGSSLVDETSPVSGPVKLKVVGHQGASGDLVANADPAVTSTLLDFTTLGLQAGDWIKFAGWTNDTDNNDYVRISAVAAAELTLDIVPSGWGVDSGAGDVIDIYMGERLINGVTKQSFTFEEEFSDHTPDVTYQYFRGMTVDGLALTAEPQSIVTINFTFSGKDAFFSTDTTPASVPDQLPAETNGRVGSATTITAIPTSVLNSSSDVGRIAQDGTPISGANFVLEASFEIGNNLRQQNAVGFLGAVSIGAGEFGCTGTLSTYFDNAELARDVVDNTETSFDIRFADDDSHIILIDAPRLKFSEGAPDVPSKNADVTLPLSYQAIRHATLGYTLAYFRFHGVQ